MSIFIKFNIQLLPLRPTIPEVGEEGYKKLFDSLRNFTKECVDAKTLDKSSFPLLHNAYFSPLFVTIYNKYSTGTWLKFNSAENVEDLYTNSSLLADTSGKTPVSHKQRFRFVFNYESHIFAIEEASGRLPAPQVVQNALDHFLSPIATSEFANHILTINLISSKKKIKEILSEASGFGRVEVQLTFPNGHANGKEVLEELKNNNVHNIKTSISPPRGEKIVKIPEFVETLLKESAKLGSSFIRYFREVGNKEVAQSYKSGTAPERLPMKKMKKESEQAYAERVSLRISIDDRVPDE